MNTYICKYTPRTAVYSSLVPSFFLVISSWDSTSALPNLISLMFMKILWRQNPYINAKNYDYFLHVIPMAQFLLCMFSLSSSVKESLYAIPLSVLQNLNHIFSWGRHWHWLVFADLNLEKIKFSLNCVSSVHYICKQMSTFEYRLSNSVLDCQIILNCVLKLCPYSILFELDFKKRILYKVLYFLSFYCLRQRLTNTQLKTTPNWVIDSHHHTWLIFWMA